MLTFLFILYFILLNLNSVTYKDFRDDQKKYRRVRTAYNEKYDILKNDLVSAGINDFKVNIFIRAYKIEEILEVWVKSPDASEYSLFRTWDICRTSGIPGPKRREGDFQIPEGFYHINHFNPYSNFYLSLGVNYPNRSDRILGHKQALGGSIYIHGSCVTIGCIPITDDLIKELYVLAVEAKTNGQEKIPVHIFPSRLVGGSFINLCNDYQDEEELLEFWMNLKKGHDAFEMTHTLPVITVAENGEYQVK